MVQPKTIFFILCFGWSLSCLAQTKISKKQFIADSIKIVEPKLIRPQFKLDNRLIFLNGQKLNISGLDAGVILKSKLRVTVGYYSLSDQLTSLKKSTDGVEYQYDLDYGALNLEFIYKNTRFFSLGMPLELGFGGNSLQSKQTSSSVEISKQSGFMALSYFGLSGTFKPIRWIGLKGAFGYRKTIFNQIENVAFDGIYTSVGLAIDFREIMTDYKMYKLKKKYRKNSNLENAVDLITD